MKYLLFFVVFIFLFFKCKSQDKSSSFSHFSISTIASLSDFDKLDSLEEKLSLKDSILFLENRARITFIPLFEDSFGIHFPPYNYAVCLAVYYRDTLQVAAGIGFFANMGYRIQIYKDSYNISYFESADNFKIFSRSQTDAKLSNNIEVPSEEKSLILMTKPTYENGEKIIGQLEMVTKPFYVYKNGKLKERKYRIKATFRCTVRRVGN